MPHESNSTGPSAVSVVLATRDRREQVLGSLRHLIALPERPPLIVVDNGSSDGTADAVELAFPSVTVIRAGRNLGAVGRTVGVRRASTPYVAFADDDSWWAPGSLTRAADIFGAAPRLAVIAARLLVGPAERLDPVCEVMGRSPLPAAPGMPGVPILGFVACGAIVRREAYLQVGGFHPLIHFLGEETVLAQDLRAAGWQLAYVDEIVAHHHPGVAPPRRGRQRLQSRNALLSSWLRRRFPVPVRDTFAVLRRFADPEMRGALRDAAARLPSALAQRRPLPPYVEAQVRLLEQRAR